jgi:hypothetical protein
VVILRPDLRPVCVRRSTGVPIIELPMMPAVSLYQNVCDRDSTFINIGFTGIPATSLVRQYTAIA